MKCRLPLRAGRRFPRLPRLPWGGSSAGRASRSQCEGRGFDPLPLHHFFSLLFLALLLPAASLAAPATTTWDQVRVRGVLRIGTTGDYAPYTILDAGDGAYVGADIALALRLALELGLRAEFVATTWKTLLGDATAGRFDVAIGGISITPERERAQFFSQAYSTDFKVPLTRCGEEQRFDTQAEINRPEVRLIENPGGTNEQFARAQFPAASLMIHVDNRTVFDEIIARRADVMVTDSVEAHLQAAAGKGLCKANTSSKWSPAQKAIMLAPDAALEHQINRALDRMDMTHTYARLRAQWMDNARLAGDAELPPARLARLIDLRLALMTEVARWKWNRKAPIVDLARESAQMESLRRRGSALGLEPLLIETFFGAQVSASKVMQTELFARWRHEGVGQFAGVLDLDKVLRPQIDSITADILAVLGKWDGKPSSREHLGAFTTQPISKRALDAALQPLIQGAKT
jgi:chorismate mutase-like protein